MILITTSPRRYILPADANKDVVLHATMSVHIGVRAQVFTPALVRFANPDLVDQTRSPKKKPDAVDRIGVLAPPLCHFGCTLAEIYEFLPARLH